MIKITNGSNVFEVSQGAFDGIYSHQGYTVMNANNSSKKERVIPKKTDDDMFLEQIVEKPISQWSKEDVKHYAALKKIDISNTKNVNEAKAIIKESIEA